MLAAIEKGDVEKLAELIRQDPGFDVNKDDDYGRTLLHHACLDSRRSAVIPLLLAHPDVDVNLKDTGGRAPLFLACYVGRPSCVREMLKDSRGKVNDSDRNGYTPLRYAYYGELDIIKWWIASRREMDLGKPGDVDGTDAIGVAKQNDETEVVTLLERFKSDAVQTRHAIEWNSAGTTKLLLRCSPWWSLSRMEYCKSTTPLRHLQPGTSPLPSSSHWSSRWCCAIAWWDQARISYQARRAK